MSDWKIVTRDLSIVVDTAIYASGDVVGGLLSADFSGVHGGGYLWSFHLLDAVAQNKAMYLYVYNGAPNIIADNGAWALTAAAGKLLRGRIAFNASDYLTLSAMGWGSIPAVNDQTGKLIHFPNLSNGLLYFYLVTNGSTPDYVATSDLYGEVTAYLI